MWCLKGEEQDLWLVGGIVQHIDSSVNERKMTDDGGQGQRRQPFGLTLAKQLDTETTQNRVV